MPNIQFPTPEGWGHDAGAITPEDIVRGVTEQAGHVLRSYAAWPEGPEPCRDREGYHRASVVIPLPSTLFDQLMNGATGYHAHYAVGIDFDETFNRSLVDAVAPMVVSSENLYCDHFGKVFCERPLLGPFSKFWFSKELTDPSAQSELLKCREELCVPRWVEYLRHQSKPRKELLAPRPGSPTVLLNGTFVSDAGAVYEQKPGRSRQIFDTGWT
jgi:hypothetical protein